MYDGSNTKRVYPDFCSYAAGCPYYNDPVMRCRTIRIHKIRLEIYDLLRLICSRTCVTPASFDDRRIERRAGKTKRKISLLRQMKFGLVIKLYWIVLIDFDFVFAVREIQVITKFPHNAFNITMIE